MDPDKQRVIASKGGQAHVKDAADQRTREQALEEGRKG